MLYYGVDSTERFIVCGENENEANYVEMVKHADAPVFSVSCCCDEEWCYDFNMVNNTEYERVKFQILNSIFECEDMDSLMKDLSEIFEDGFGEILVKNECDCDGKCEHCKCKE